MRSRTKFRLAAMVLVAIHAAALFAGFLAPYDPKGQDRAHPYAPPMRLHFIDNRGKLHLWPFVYRLTERRENIGSYEEDRSRTYPIRIFVRGARYKLAGRFETDWHLFGTDAAARIYWFGTDGYGRDQFSRLLYGGQISLFAGLLATGLSLGLGLIVGALAGFYGRWLDEALMRGAELFLALPWLYLLFAVRAFLPLQISPTEAFTLLIVVIGLVGWARPARLIRGVVLSAKERNYVLAARGFGASDLYLLRRHVLPQTWGVVLTQAALLIPQYILAEVTLSYLGLGVGEPVPSWGNMLSSLQQYYVLASYWWMLAPGITLIPVFLSYYALANALHERVGSASI